MKQESQDDILVTVLEVSVHRRNANPIFGETAIHVRVEDEAGGPFIVLKACDPSDEGLRIDMDELEAVTKAARNLIDKMPKEQA